MSVSAIYGLNDDVMLTSLRRGASSAEREYLISVRALCCNVLSRRKTQSVILWLQHCRLFQLVCLQGDVLIMSVLSWLVTAEAQLCQRLLMACRDLVCFGCICSATSTASTTCCGQIILHMTTLGGHLFCFVFFYQDT